ncbi:hypothetical protein GCM10010193_70150 [Kitasatospora atroaurantiaca]|uniref:Uncharacterized protein n=1 Tax=Kitasatospora atroaurantiaca TaxID=285545 RepID=A0A561EN98_9ACTN|nr:hypothetical protein [Kitasatospora atroaurantiaca]TWE17101.1 hypothetical protein FB465_2106 [Kitasatospora atroaurantiaca]
MAQNIAECGTCGETNFCNWYGKDAPKDSYGRIDRDYMDSNPVAYCSEECRDKADAGPTTPEDTVATNQIPTDLSDLIALLNATPANERQQISDRLAAQLGDQERSYKLFDEAETVVRNDEQIEVLRGELGGAIGEALMSIREAEGLIDRLASNGVYDIEYAESVAAADLRHVVAEASRAMRIAQALQSHIER